MQRGILSYRQAAKQCPKHASVADVVVQGRRDEVHRYANLYFHARNPMMYRLKDRAHQLCVLAVDITIALLEAILKWKPRWDSPEEREYILDTIDHLIQFRWMKPERA